MKFLGDMGISPRILSQLTADGHEVFHAQDLGMSKATDFQLIKHARKDNMILLTNDLDFGDLLASGADSLPSVIIFRLKDMRPNNVF